MTVAALVLAGGRGQRLRPLTDDCPKPLLDIGGEPVIAHPLRRLAAAGITDVVLATSYLADRFEAALGDGSRYGVRLRYAVQHQPRGTAGAFLPAAGLLSDVDTVIVLNADELGGHDLAAQLDAFAAARSSAAAVGCLHVRYVPDLRAFGAVTVTPGGWVQAFEEKPATGGAGLANAGCYVFSVDVISSVAAQCDRLATTNPEWSLSLERDVLPALLASGSKILAYRDDSAGLDIGTPAALTLARERCT
ncbi:nucleotidyltransferase family protein [Branchiibius sp. NY16-3462-2]|uniref:nucleotidyltransferase family protein n=1 Tax=Branchiibius sp. NY16-3462-2 TaxID=1807500 RepID=UPI000795F3D2|nr:nucleotidyltransferase family protein [Branchiibius sp. NY16-3462-2]KYH44347.1 hypothetical protein AZH51_07360 [Branchiibius sp. NY16-3462-2]